MKISEKLILEEISKRGKELYLLLKGLTVGQMVALIRKQFKMSQRILAKRARVPQSTISNLEQSKKQPNLATLKKILEALFCDLVLVPILREPIEVLRRKQARKKAEKHIRYLKGTMSLEKQEPDSRLLEELIKEETEELFKSNNLWELDENV